MKIAILVFVHLIVNYILTTLIGFIAPIVEGSHYITPFPTQKHSFFELIIFNTL